MPLIDDKTVSDDEHEEKDQENENENESTLVLLTALEVNAPDSESFFRLCIYSGAQLIFVGLHQSKAYCSDVGGDIEAKIVPNVWVW